MKLTDLNPRFFTEAGNDGKVVGLSFDCPHCTVQRLAVHFHDADHSLIGVQEPDALRLAPNTKVWELTGKGLDDLSLTPSVDASASGHWHGFITSGCIV